MNRNGAPIIYMTSGISGSGKSFFADKFISKNGSNTIELNLDNYRRTLGDVSDQSLSKMAVQLMNADMAKYLAGGYNVFLSNTNLDVSSVNRVAKAYPLNDVVLFLTKDSYDVQLCKDRIADDLANGTDRSKVPDDVVDKQHERFLKLIDNIGQIADNVDVMMVDSKGNYSRV